jgi:hypothetical protein
MHNKPIVKLLLLGLTGLAALIGTAWPAQAVNPNGGAHTYFAATPMNSSYSSPTSKRVNWTARVNSAGCSIDPTSVVPDIQHTFYMELICGCLGGGGNLITGNGASHPLTIFDDLTYDCGVPRGQEMLSYLRITN